MKDGEREEEPMVALQGREGRQAHSSSRGPKARDKLPLREAIVVGDADEEGEAAAEDVAITAATPQSRTNRSRFPPQQISPTSPPQLPQPKHPKDQKISDFLTGRRILGRRRSIPQRQRRTGTMMDGLSWTSRRVLGSRRRPQYHHSSQLRRHAEPTPSGPIPRRCVV